VSVRVPLKGQNTTAAKRCWSPPTVSRWPIAITAANRRGNILIEPILGGGPVKSTRPRRPRVALGPRRRPRRARRRRPRPTGCSQVTLRDGLIETAAPQAVACRYPTHAWETDIHIPCGPATGRHVAVPDAPDRSLFTPRNRLRPGYVGTAALPQAPASTRCSPSAVAICAVASVFGR